MGLKRKKILADQKAYYEQRLNDRLAEMSAKGITGPKADKDPIVRKLKARLKATAMRIRTIADSDKRGEDARKAKEAAKAAKAAPKPEKGEGGKAEKPKKGGEAGKEKKPKPEKKEKAPKPPKEAKEGGEAPKPEAPKPEAPAAAEPEKS